MGGRLRLRVRAALPPRLLQHLLVLVLAHLLAPLLDYRTQANSRACVIDGLEKPSRRAAAPNHTVRGFCLVGGPVADPRIVGNVLQRRARGAPPAHPALPREGGRAPPGGV